MISSDVSGSSSESSDPFSRLEPGFLAGSGRYLLERALSSDALSVDWLGLDNQLNEKVALRFYRAEVGQDSTALNNLRRDVQKSRKLNHRNIVRIHDLYHGAQEPLFVVMEYVEGVELGTLRLDQPYEAFSWAILKPTVQQVCNALDYAHGQGYVHGNINPATFLLDRHGRLKLADFGFPRFRRGLVRGISDEEFNKSLSYVSPQQLEDGSAQASDDIYSMGAVLYELLTGTPPFHTGDILHQIRSVPPQPLADRAAENAVPNEIPSHISALILACLAKDPAERPKDAVAIGDWISATGANAGSAGADVISLIPPPEPSVTASLTGTAAIEEAQEFARSLPEPLETNEAAISRRIVSGKSLAVLALVLGVLLFAAAYFWRGHQFDDTATGTKATNAPTTTVPNELPDDSAESNRNLEALLADVPVASAQGTFVGQGPAFSYRYAPREAGDLDTNAVNFGVRFGQATGNRGHCAYLVTLARTNNSIGTVTYLFRAAPGYLIEDMHISQRSALYTSGRIRGVYSVDGGKTFEEFYLTPPYAGRPLGFTRAAELTSLNSSNVLVRYILHRFAGRDNQLQFLRDCDDAPAALEISGSVVPKSQKEGQEVSATPTESQQLKTVQTADGPFTIRKEGQASAWVVPKNAKAPHYLYFDVDDAFRPNPGGAMMIEIDYFGSGFGSIILHYDSTDANLPYNGAYKAHPNTIHRLSTERWQKASWVLTDARFAGSQNAHADFRFYVSGDDLLIRKVRVIRLGQ